MKKQNTLSLSKRIIYIYISMALFLLWPSFYGLTYCFVSEKFVERVPSLERLLSLEIELLENRNLICQPPKNGRVKRNDITPSEISNHNYDIRISCPGLTPKELSADFVADHIYPVYILNIGYIKHFKTLESTIYDLFLYIFDMDVDELYCYHSKYDDNYDELKKIYVPPKKENETFAERTFRERREKEFKEEYGEPLEVRKKNAKINHAKHIATLKDYLDKIQAARLAHEPHRPMIRFIGWFWLFFEIIGMILVFGGAFLQLRQIIKKRQKKYPRLSDFRDDDEF